jgi:hypothetical protein
MGEANLCDRRGRDAGDTGHRRGAGVEIDSDCDERKRNERPGGYHRKISSVCRKKDCLRTASSRRRKQSNDTCMTNCAVRAANSDIRDDSNDAAAFWYETTGNGYD